MHTTKNEKPQEARYASTHPNPGASHSPLTIPDDSELAAELSAVDGLPLAEARRIATIHLRRLPHGSGAGPVCTNCGQYGHTAIDCPQPPLPRPPAQVVGRLGALQTAFRADGWPLCPHCGDDELWSPLFWDGSGERPPIQAYIDAGLSCYRCGPVLHPQRPSRVNWSDRERCDYCTGPHATIDCRLRKPVFVGAPEACGNCGGDHSTQRCPELWQALRTPAPDTGLALIVELLHLARRELAELRAAGLHSAANSVCADAVGAVEAWLDPEAAAIRAEQVAAGRALVRATLAERVVLDGIAVPF